MSPGAKAVRMGEILNTITTNSLSKDVDFLSEIFPSKLQSDSVLRSLRRIDKADYMKVWEEVCILTQDIIYRVAVFCLGAEMAPEDAIGILKGAGLESELKGVNSRMVTWLLERDTATEWG
jgi:hypothetical protein